MSIERESSVISGLIEWFQSILPLITTFWLAAWGGVVRHVQGLRESGKNFSFREFLFDLIISAFVGFLTYYLCLYANITGPLQAILIATSGHMGTRALSGFENFRDRILGFKKVN